MKLFLFILQMLPTVLSGVKAIEDHYGSALPGTSKKQLLMDAVQIAAQTGEAIPNGGVQAISTLADKVVGAFNASGVFTKATPKT